MVESIDGASHSAASSALGFYYQTFFALLTLLECETDDAAVAVEQLDDVVLVADGQTLLIQLKHSITTAPPAITVKSRALWRTMKVWIDVLPGLKLEETTLHLVTVATIPADSPLIALTSDSASREDLVIIMREEAQRVAEERASAANEGRALPHSDRSDGCKAFLSLSGTDQLNLLRRTCIRLDSPRIGDIEDLVAKQLKLVPPEERPKIATRLIEWWDRQVVYSLCGKREHVISRAELQHQITVIIGDIEQGNLLPDFETVSHPEEYQPNGMLARQIRLVEGRASDLSRAIREEWKAREQRAKWMNERPSLATVIGEYDLVLLEYWSDLHDQMVEECADADDEAKRASGRAILRWSHEDAPNRVRPIDEGWNAPYYVRGSYQILAIDLMVGWHPNYLTLLEAG